MPRLPDTKGILRFFKRMKSRGPSKFIFTGKQWGIFLVVLVLLMTASGIGTRLVLSSRNKAAIQEARERESYYAGGDQILLFEKGRIRIPEMFKGERHSQPGIFRVKRDSWSDSQIRGTDGDGRWTDPALISTDIFEDKNDALIKNMLEEVR